MHRRLWIELPGCAGKIVNSSDVRCDVQPTSRVIVFTRFPEAGKTKTRMIPELGAEGATALHVALTRHTLRTVQAFCKQSTCELEVRFAGGSVAAMCEVFGSDINYRVQCAGDLGARLTDAFAEALYEGASRIVVIGSDCPDIQATDIDEAICSMPDFDVVLGPALDGGYYLIGLCADQRQLFADIDWGSDQVLKQTLDRAHRSGMRVHCLRPLSDVDHPEDLTVCQRYPESFSGLLSTSFEIIRHKST